jgi:hypothetical protein
MPANPDHPGPNHLNGAHAKSMSTIEVIGPRMVRIGTLRGPAMRSTDRILIDRLL